MLFLTHLGSACPCTRYIDQRISVRFAISRLPERRAHYALDKLRKLPQFWNPKPEFAHGPTPWNGELNLANIDLNNRQIQAVRQIVEGNYYPMPYIVFGPPGTGKALVY